MGVWLALGLNSEPVVPAQIRFVDMAAQVGIHFEHHNGASNKKRLPETTGSGAVFLMPMATTIWTFTWWTAAI
tara:strand:- start:472 stop:690 length:219 start_codon:yes stop_codon:yes gene_type:complete